MATRSRNSEVTSARILRAARRRFAAEGYERTTIRAVAADAEIDPSLVMRYFGNKEGLFAAAASFDLELPDLSGVPRRELGAALVRHFLARWEREGDDLRVLLRTAPTNDAAARRMRAIFQQQLVPALTALHGPDVAELRAGLIATQMLGLAFCRYVLRLPAIARLSAEELAAEIGPTIQRYATG
jgi:AcrR family transcriptional regulator